MSHLARGGSLPDEWAPWLLPVALVCLVAAVVLGRRERRNRREAVREGRMSPERLAAVEERERETRAAVMRGSVKLGVPATVLFLALAVAFVVMGEKGGWPLLGLAGAAVVFWAVLIPRARRQGKI